MKNLMTDIFVISIILFINLGCGKLNSTFADGYNLASCKVDGKPEAENVADYLQRAEIHEEKNEYMCQFYACQQVVTLNAKNSDGYSCRGQGIYNYQKDYAQAISDLTTAITLHPKRDYYWRRAVIHELENQPDKALSDYEKCFELSTTPTEKGVAKSSIAEIYLQKNQLDSALTAINEAINLMPDYAANYATRAEIYRKQSKTDLAEADSRKMIELKSGTESPPSSKPIDVGILNRKAIKLLKPTTPAIAKEAGVSVTVKVLVVLDEQGKVVSAEAFSGPTTLYRTAQNAAANSKFPPILVDGKPARVMGIVVYDFPKN
jgi:tetratricopeptide (TPR) repeat protein